jgi:hypothetical protein
MSALQQPQPAAAPTPSPRQLTSLVSSQPGPVEPRCAQGDQGEICQVCGGSGMLRLGDQRFRTCLHCLGRGRLEALSSDSTVAEVLQLDSRRLSAAVSSAAAR